MVGDSACLSGPDPGGPDRDRDPGPELEQFHADRAAGDVLALGVAQADTTERLQTTRERGSIENA